MGGSGLYTTSNITPCDDHFHDNLVEFRSGEGDGVEAGVEAGEGVDDGILNSGGGKVGEG